MDETSYRCRCGETEIVAAGPAIVGAVCGCTHCMAAERAFVTMGAPASSTAGEGVPAVLYRNDRVRLVRGGERLRQYRLAAGSPTRRIVATCCTTPMFLDFEQGFWLSLYRDRAAVPEAAVPLRSANWRFGIKLMAAFAGAGFRKPAVAPGLAGLPESVLPAA